MMKYRLKQLIAGFCALALLCTELPLARAAGETINLTGVETKIVAVPGILSADNQATIENPNIVDVTSDYCACNGTGVGNIHDLSDAEFAIDKNQDGTYHVKSTRNNIYLAVNNASDAYRPTATQAENLHFFRKEDGSFVIYDLRSDGKWYCLWYNKSDNQFNRATGYISNGNYLTSFYIFQKKTTVDAEDIIPGYKQVENADDIRMGEKYLIAAKNGETYYLLYPVYNAERDDYRAQVRTRITFTAKSAGTTKVTVGGQTYTVNVTGLWSDSRQSGWLDKPNDQRIALDVNDSVTVYHGGGAYTDSDVSWSYQEIANASLTTELDSVVANLGNNEKETVAAACLYQFTASDGGYIISGTTENGKKVYLNLTANPNTIHSTTEQAVFSVKSANGKFEFRASDDTHDTQLFLNQHKNFNGVDQDASKRVSQFVLYTPEKDTNLDSDELPGYRRVTEIEAGQSYLIAAYSDGTFYFVFPSDSTDNGKRNLHVAEAKKTYLPNATKITFTAQQPGMTVATIGGTKYTIVVRDPNAVSAAKGVAVDRTVEKLRLSKNATFDVRMPSTFTEIPTNTDSSIATATVSGQVATIQAKGVGTTTFNFGGKTLEVEVVDTGSSDGALIDYYVEEVTHTKAYYTILEQDGSFSEFAEVKQQEVLWLYVQGSGKSLHFFGAPEPNAALTILGATNSAGNYKKLDDTDPEKTEFYQGTDTIRYNPGGANVTQEAINKGCFGGFSFTLNHSISSNLTFRSEYLPIVTAKPIRIEERDAAGNVTSTPYVDGEPVKAGSWVIFGIEIRVFDKDNITYDSITLGNSLDDQTLDFAPVMNETTFGEGGNPIILKDKKADGTTIEVPVTVNKKMNADDGSVTYGVELPCQMKAEDATKFEQGAALENRISMEYTYTAKYQSSGESALCNSSTAVAVLTISLADRLTHMNLSLGSTIGANVYFPVEEGTNGAEQSEWLKTSDSSNKSFVGPYFVAFGITDAEGKLITHIGDPIPFASGVAAVIGKGDDAKTCRRFTVDISPMDMTQEISVFVTDKDGNRVSGIQKLKVNDYANALLDEKNKDSLITE